MNPIECTAVMKFHNGRSVLQEQNLILKSSAATTQNASVFYGGK